MESGDDLSSRAVASQVLSALRSLTSVFGMGTGGTFSPLSPEISGSQVPVASLCFLACSVLSCFRLTSLRSPSACSLLRVPFVPSKPHTGMLSSFSRSSSVFRPGLTFASFRSSPRPISIGNLSHHCVYSANLSTLSSSRGLTGFCHGILVLEGGFTLRCFQRLSRPYFASLLCRWHDNSCTRGTSTPVLSY